ncbi:DinB family protein [Streptomyces sp. NRRL B-24484]|uniref:DinB family protein n=1 Tax=Streptomyces sp. NRRL B-24484 TaxID=1463833 RepID=UPI000694D371|nr:DinB family protein [Streptomyces sp. NRRL B-24484]
MTENPEKSDGPATENPVPAIPPQNYSQTWDDGGARPALPLVGDEREILTAYLEHHRETLALKCAGLTPAQLSEHAVPPSRLTLHGLLRHLAGVERWWLHLQFAGLPTEMLYYSDDDPDQDFESLDGDPAQALAVWRAECERSREIVAAAPSLDVTGVHRATGQPVSLRRILVHMIAEYARHDGHADLLRERLDGATGY